MKKIFVLLALNFVFLVGFAQFEKIELQASGLTCSMCSNAIHKALQTLPFTEAVHTDLNKNLFSISIKKNVPVDLDQVKMKVIQAGFSVAQFWVTLQLPATDIRNDAHVALNGLNFHFVDVRNQAIKGEVRLQVIDHDFVSAKEFKKFKTRTSMPCFETGTMASCCKSANGELASSSRIYHVTI